jgi:hypothetical protein
MKESMRDGVDVPLVTALLERLAPSLAEDVRVARGTGPSLSEPDALDAALRAAVMRLRFELNQQTFEFLRHKVLVAKGNAATALAALKATREAQRRWPLPESIDPLREWAKPRTGEDEPFERPRHARFLRILGSVRERLASVLVDFSPEERHVLTERMAALQIRYEDLEPDTAPSPAHFQNSDAIRIT